MAKFCLGNRWHIRVVEPRGKHYCKIVLCYHFYNKVKMKGWEHKLKTFRGLRGQLILVTLDHLCPHNDWVQGPLDHLTPRKNSVFMKVKISNVIFSVYVYDIELVSSQLLEYILVCMSMQKPQNVTTWLLDQLCSQPFIYTLHRNVAKYNK